MNAAAFLGASRQCHGHAEVLLDAVDSREWNPELDRALIRSVLYHLDSALVMYLRALGENYAPGVGALINDPRDLNAQLVKAGVSSPEAVEVVRLSSDPNSWLYACLEACQDLSSPGFTRALVETSRGTSKGDIMVYQEHEKRREPPSAELLRMWLRALRELRDRHYALMAEY